MMITPNVSFDFTTAVLDSRITFARTTGVSNPATYIDSSGLIATAANNQARFDHNSISLSCQGFLIEESRQNKITYSQDFSNGVFTKTRSAVVDGSAISPDGTLNAEKLRADTTASATHLLATGAFNVGGQGVVSVFAKAAELSKIGIRESTATGAYATFDLVAGTVLDSGAGASAAKVTPFANSWYRVEFRINTGSNISFAFFLLPDTYTTGNPNTAAGAFNGDGVSGLYIWGAQLEAGAFATSYIPTTNAALTRNADVATISGTAFSGVWRSGPGSILVRALPSTVSGTRPLVQVDDATADNIIALRGNTTNPELYIRAGGADQATIDVGTISVAAYRLAGAWQAGSAAAALNSGLAVNGAPASIPAVTQMRLGSDGTNYLNGHLQAVQYWPVRLGNAGLQTASSTAGYGGILAPVMQDAMLYPQINRSFGL